MKSQIINTFYSKKYFIIAGLFLIHFKVSSQCTYLSCLPEGALYEVHPLYYEQGKTKFSTITSKIPELSQLGIRTIYMMPVFSISGIKPNTPDNIRLGNLYNIENYYAIDTFYGTSSELKTLVSTAHTHQIRVLFDLVLNHTYYPSVFMDSSWDYRISLADLQAKASSLGHIVQYDTVSTSIFPYVNKQYAGTDSIYDFRGWLQNGIVHVMHYPTFRWWFALDYANPNLIRYIVNLSKYFISQYDFDGWRLDAPANNWNPDYFSADHSMVSLLQAVKGAMVAIKSSCVIISEDASSGRKETDPNDFDQMVEASYHANYLLNTLATSGAADYPSYKVSDLLAQLNTENILYNRSRLRYSETHDSPRINAESPSLNIPLLVFNATIYPGIPMIQAGQEIGATNILYSIQTNYNSSQQKMWDSYQKVLHIRNSHNCLKYGTLQNVLVSTNATDASKTYSYIRDYNNEKILVMVNFSDETVNNTLNLPYTQGTILTDSLNAEQFQITTPSNMQISLPPYSARILIPVTISSLARSVNNFAYDVVIYPNPSNGQFIFNLIGTPDKEYTIEIFNIQGRQILLKTIINSIATVDLSGYPKGVYVAKFLVKGRGVYKKLCVE